MRVAVVHPLRALGVVDEMIVDDVDQHRDAAPVAFAHKMLESVGTAAGMLDREVMRGAVSPAPALRFRQRHQLDCVDAEFDQMIEQVDGVVERPRQWVAGRIAFFGAEAVHMHFVDHEFVQAFGHWPAPIVLRSCALGFGSPAALGMPHAHVWCGVSTMTPQRKVHPRCAPSNRTSARQAGQPSGAVNFFMAIVRSWSE
jgi:hypothetical protein